MSDLTDPSATPTLTPGDAISSTTTGADTSLTQGNIYGPNFFVPSSDEQTVSPNAPSSTETTNIINVTSTNRNNFITVNCLDPYVDVTYGMSFAMISPNAIKQISESGEMAIDPAEIARSDYIVFASTGDTATNANVNIDYYNIHRLEFTSIVAHQPQNPLTAIIIEAKMRVFEPYGFSLIEDIETMRKQLGYPDGIARYLFTYRLEIWFSGWNPKTGQWFKYIPIPKTNDTNLSSVVYFVTITMVEAKVTTTGTEYDLSLQIFAHKTMRSEALTYHLESSVAGNSSASSGSTQPNAAQSEAVKIGPAGGGPATLREFLYNLGVALKQQVNTDTDGHLEVDYKFYGPTALFDARFDGSESATGIAHASPTYNADTGVYTYAGKDIDILSYIYRAMDHLKIVRAGKIAIDDPGLAKTPGVTWNVRHNFQQGDAVDYQINEYKTYTYEYYIEPVLSFRERTTLTPHRNDKAMYQNQLARVNLMIQFGMLVRTYDFLFTNDNSEVIDWDVNFKAFYYDVYPNTGSDTLPANAQQGKDIDWTQEIKNRLSSTVTENNNLSFQSDPTNSTLPQTLGLPSPDPNQVSTTSNAAGAAYALQNQGRGPDITASMNLQKNEASPDMKLYLRSKDQYFRYEMQNVQLTVRFDPVWLLNPYMGGGDFTPKMPVEQSEQNKFLYIHLDRVVWIKAYRPVQTDFMNPLRQGGSSKKSGILGGFFQVLSIVNLFDGGKFVQTLNLFKYPHFNGFDDSSISGSQGQPTDLQSDPNTPNPLTQQG